MSKAVWKNARHLPTIIKYREPVPNTLRTTEKAGQIIKEEKVEAIETREGEIYAIPGIDYVIKGTAGELYPIKKSIFEQTYEAI